jgi:hypothetical protein
VKARSEGLQIALDSFEVSLAPGEQAGFRSKGEFGWSQEEEHAETVGRNKASLDDRQERDTAEQGASRTMLLEIQSPLLRPLARVDLPGYIQAHPKSSARTAGRSRRCATGFFLPGFAVQGEISECVTW